MSGMGSIARILTIPVLAASVTGKMRDIRGFARSAAAILPGIPGGLIASVTVLAELAVLAMLLVVPTLGAWCAAVLFAGFTLVVLRVVRSGAARSCHCFGLNDNHVIAPVDVVRNLLLIASALVATSGGPLWLGRGADRVTQLVLAALAAFVLSNWQGTIELLAPTRSLRRP